MINVPTSINIPDYHFLKTADIVVERVGDRARAVDRHGNLIAESDDYVDVWQKAIDAAPSYGVVAGLGEFVFDRAVTVRKPITIAGGVFVRDPSVGTNSHSFFNVGNEKGESLVDGPVKFIGCYFDGNERNITQKYTEPMGAPVHVGITLLRVKKVIIEGCVFKDMAREAIWITCVECQEGVIDHEEIIITKNFFENVAYGVTAESYKKIIVSNNIVRGLNAGNENGGSYSVANPFFALNYLDVEETIIENNIIDGEVPEGYPYAGTWGFTAVKQGGGVSGKRRIIANNYITHVKVGIFTAYQSVIDGNIIYDVETGMDLYVAKGNIVRGNEIRRFTNVGIACEGAGGDYAEENIIEGNYIDDEGQGASYGIKSWSYARHNIILRNIVKGSIQTPVSIWPDPNLTDMVIYDSSSLSNLSSLLANFPYLAGNVIIFHYDGTYYYMVQVDLKNKALRKVQLS